MKYKPYPAYRDSGVAWLPYIPNDWSTLPLRYVAKSSDSVFIDGDWIESKDISDDGVRYITTGNVGEGVYKEQGSGYISEETFSALNCTEVKPGDILISRLNLPIGRSCLVPDLGSKIVTSVDNVIVRPASNIESSYLVYLLTAKEYFAHTEILARGTTMQRISRTILGNIRVCLPSAEEQTGISTFLDRETAKLDTLIAKQEKLIELLQEKRQALISHAVTKGLNPDAPMKDSGVAWLGEVPEHWGVTPIKHIVSVPVTDGPHETPEFFDEGVPFVSAEAVSTGKIDFEKIRGFISVEDHRRYSLKYSPRIHDIYMVKSGATTGVSAIVETDSEFNIWSPLAVIRCGDAANPYFILNVIRSRNFQESVALNWSFGTQQNIGMGVIQNLPVPIPPLEEQAEIASYLGAESNKLDTLIEKSRRSIELMREHRTALISAAVTGKIDVREAA